MSRVVNGMHVSNNKHWDVEKMIQSMKGNGAATILHHLMFPRDEMVDQWGDVENAYWFGKLRMGWIHQGIAPAPERLIHVRMFQPNWYQIDPVAWAQHSAAVLSNWRFEGLSADLWQDPFVCVSPCNEQNIEPMLSRSTDAYVLMANWQHKFWNEIDRLIPGRKALSCFGAFAQGHDPDYADVPDGEYKIPQVKALVERVDIMATHPYGHLEWGAAGPATVPGGADEYWHMLRDFRPEGWRDSRQPGHPHDPGGIRAQFPKKPLLFTESGTFSHADAAMTDATLAAMGRLLKRCAEDGNVLGVTWFIWNSDESHPTNTIQGNARLRDALAGLPGYSTTAKVPVRGATPPQGGDPLSEDEKAIVAAGEAAQVMRLNPSAAIQREMLAQGFVPTSNEHDVRGSREFVSQRGERLADGAVRFFYCIKGAWNAVYTVDRPKA